MNNIENRRQLIDAVYDKAKELDHPITKEVTYWAVKAFIEVLIDVIKEDKYLCITGCFTLQRKWLNPRRYYGFGNPIYKEGKYVPFIKFGSRMQSAALENTDEGEE